jgi:hypothetical protein
MRQDFKSFHLERNVLVRVSSTRTVLAMNTKTVKVPIETST